MFPAAVPLPGLVVVTETKSGPELLKKESGSPLASVAVIGDLLATGDPEARTRAFVERLSRSEWPRV